ncbi:citrate synthase [bacterium]|nr:citrate synthase [bacterium]
MSANTAELNYAGKTYRFPIVTGSEGEKGIDISTLRRDTGLVTYDSSFQNTASCRSSITYIDGEQGILRYYGYPIEEIAGRYTFVETAYLLLHGEFPTKEQRAQFSRKLNEYSLLHEDMVHFFDGFPRGAHPMHILSTMINALATFYPNVDLLSLKEDIDTSATRLISIVRTLAAFAYKKSIGEPMVYPRHDLSYCANFLNMMFNSPVKPYKIDADIVDALNLLLVLHADHEQNCSTTAVRVIGSAQVNLYATISAGISALSGPLHGGANQEVMNMLRQIQSRSETVDSVLARAKDKKDPFLLMGFGHRIYKSYDPRARIIREMCAKILDKLHVRDPLLDIARELEEKALKDEYFVDRNLYPNVDFYSGIIYHAIGIPEDMFTVMFTLGRLPGWIAQWREMVQDKNRKIARPRQIYTGPALRHCPEPHR